MESDNYFETILRAVAEKAKEQPGKAMVYHIPAANFEPIQPLAGIYENDKMRSYKITVEYREHDR